MGSRSRSDRSRALLLVLWVVALLVPVALVVLVLGSMAVSLLGLQHHGVEVVGTIRAVMPALSWPEISLPKRNRELTSESVRPTGTLHKVRSG